MDGLALYTLYLQTTAFKDQFVEPYRQGRIQATSNIYEAGLTDCHIKILEPFAIKANLIVPVIRGSRRVLTGLLAINQCSAPRNWQPSEIELVSQIATQIGLGIDRAYLIEKTRVSAERAQNAQRPYPKNVSGDR
ncbi:MAG: GAF domain-containing protein [Hydrococcus sp. CSU_1_8]|nr:GAF domain-containing protein [Hydrococcus sp. CSU_1_8]